jgi:hypothetical protein
MAAHRLCGGDNRRRVNIEGKREIVGLGIGPSEAEPFWSGCPMGLYICTIDLRPGENQDWPGQSGVQHDTNGLGHRSGRASLMN